MKYLNLQKLLSIFLILIAISSLILYLQSTFRTSNDPTPIASLSPSNRALPSNTSSPSPSPLPSTITLSGGYHTFQTFNNCGPASLSMVLSYYGKSISQQEIGNYLRPYQNSEGNNDDKSVTLEELGTYASKFGYTPYHRPAGNIDLIKRSINSGFPVIARTWTKPSEDIGHYRVIKGYDTNRQIIIQDDSLQGHDLEYSYSDFNVLWEKFNYEYLILIPSEQNNLASYILASHLDQTTAWQEARNLALSQLEKNPSDIYTHFNLSIAYYHLDNYSKSVKEYEQIEDSLPFRTLWYQIEPIQAYYELGNYDKVFEITNNILSNGNRAFSELYLIRGQIYETEDKLDLARQEYEKAILYNSNLKSAREALSSL